MEIEYSQTKIFCKDTFDVIGYIKDKQYKTEITFQDNWITQDFYDICKSWDLFGSRLELNGNVLSYGETQSGTGAYEYNKFMSLIVSYFCNDFKRKE